MPPIDDLLNRAQHYGSPARFHFVIDGPVHSQDAPAFLQVPTIPDALQRGVLCHTTTLPSRSIASSEEAINGPARTLPHSVLFANELHNTFYWSGKDKAECQAIYRFFYNWHTHIVGRPARPGNNSYTASSFFGLGFYDSYIVDARLLIYSSVNTNGPAPGFTIPLETPLAVFKFYEAYPLSLAPIMFNWADGDSVLQFGVTFAYRVWEQVF